MTKVMDVEHIRKVLSELSAMVSNLPEHLQEAAFSLLLTRALDVHIGAHKDTTKPTGAPHHAGHTSVVAAGSTFGDYYAGFPAELNMDQKLLIACSFAETQTDDKSFSIDAAHNLLKDLGIKLSNATVYAKRLKSKKLIITLGKSGKTTYKFRVSADGHKYLKKLMEPEQ